MVYIDPRTGLMFENESIARSLGYGQAPAPMPVAQAPLTYQNSDGTTGIDYRERDANGNLTTNQIGSQFWMNAGYTGPEPTMEVKRAFSSAEYASGWIGNYAQQLINTGVPVTQGVRDMAKYPAATSPILLQLWKDYPQFSPAAALQNRYGNPTGSGSGISPTSLGSNTVPAANVDPLINTGGLTAVSGWIATLSKYAIYIVAAVAIAIGLLAIWRGSNG
jgi:hypothetical protein